MSDKHGKRPIDIQREAGFKMRIGATHDSEIRELISTSDGLYVMTTSSVYKLILADHVDPQRTNPNIKNANQQILSKGIDNEIVARIVLQAKYLFDRSNSNLDKFSEKLLTICFNLARNFLNLNNMIESLDQEIEGKERELSNNINVNHSFLVPSVDSIDLKFSNLIMQADKSKDDILSLFWLRFCSNADQKLEIRKLKDAVADFLLKESSFRSQWESFLNYQAMIRNVRNAIVHPGVDKEVNLSDFSLHSDGHIYPPMIEVIHPETPFSKVLLREFIGFIKNSLIEYAECSLVFICLSRMAENNPLNASIVEFPEEMRRNKHVRFYRSINYAGDWHILG